MKSRRYTMAEAVSVARQAAQEIEAWLEKLPQTLSVTNVEEDPRYQAEDVDLLWTTQKASYKVEIKGDRWHETGNFFFETISNLEKGRLGCFLYSEADLFFYYFVESKDLYILPMPATREWFLDNLMRFKERSTGTPLGNRKSYTTVGRLVPVETVPEEVPGVRKYELGED